jgi:hypothetical protein
MTNTTKPSDKPKPYRFVSDQDPWYHILKVYRRGHKKRIAIIYYGDSDELATQLSALLAKSPDLLPSCNSLVAELMAELTFGDPEEIRFHRRFDCRLIAGLQQAIIDTVRRSA